MSPTRTLTHVGMSVGLGLRAGCCAGVGKMKSFERCANSCRLNASLDCFRRVPGFVGLAGGAVGVGTSGAIRWVDAAESLSDCVRSIVTGGDAFEAGKGTLCCVCVSG